MKKKIEIFKRDILYQYYCIKANKSRIRSQVVHAFAKMLLKKYNYIGTPQRVTYYVSLERQDYQNFMDSAMEKVPKKCKLQKQVHIGINLRNLAVLLLRKDVFAQTKLITLPQIDEEETIVKPHFWERIIIFFNLITGMGIYDSFSKLDFSQTKKIVVLGDVWQEESMLLQCTNDKGITSVTCQHALFIPGIDNLTYDILNMWRVKAKEALLWGRYTEEQYKNFNPSLKCKICGNPTIIEKKCHENTDIIGIAMDLPRMHEYNQKMIDVVENYAKNNLKKVRIRIHPADKKENYRVDGRICEFSSDLDSTFFIVAHTTTMIFTYLLSGKKVLKFKSDVLFFPIDERMSFDKLEGLTKCVEHFENFDGSRMAKNEISYIGEESAFKYKECLKIKED